MRRRSKISSCSVHVDSRRFSLVALAPISVEADFSTVDIGFAGDELQRIEFVDRLGQRTRLMLSGIDRSPRLADDEFQFEIPAGVDVIGEDDM